MLENSSISKCTFTNCDIYGYYTGFLASQGIVGTNINNIYVNDSKLSGKNQDITFAGGMVWDSDISNVYYDVDIEAFFIDNVRYKSDGTTYVYITTFMNYYSNSKICNNVILIDCNVFGYGSILDSTNEGYEHVISLVHSDAKSIKLPATGDVVFSQNLCQLSYDINADNVIDSFCLYFGRSINNLNSFTVKDNVFNLSQLAPIGTVNKNNIVNSTDAMYTGDYAITTDDKYGFNTPIWAMIDGELYLVNGSITEAEYGKYEVKYLVEDLQGNYQLENTVGGYFGEIGETTNFSPADRVGFSKQVTNVVLK